jgi:transposase
VGLTKKEIRERKAYLIQLHKEGYDLSEMMKHYDKKYGTHYHQRLFLAGELS